MELTNITEVRKRLKPEGLSLIELLTNGGKQQVYFCSEQNLYKLIMRSDKPQAEPFQDWVCGEVLPSIRKNEQIMLFEHPQFGQIRTAGTPDNPLFCLADICKVLDLQAAAVMRRLEKGVISSHPLQTAGGIQQLNFVNEDGLYDVILDSRKPETKAFRKWVTSEILPSIRKNEQIMLFEHPQFGQIRAIIINNEPWFVGKDIAERLGYSNPRKAISDHIDEDDKGVTKCYTLGGQQELTIINESGLYSLVLRSNLLTAKQFKKWVTSEVLPSIRKHGAYAKHTTSYEKHTTSLNSLPNFSNPAEADHRNARQSTVLPC